MVRCKVGMGFNSVHTMEPITTSDCSWIARWVLCICRRVSRPLGVVARFRVFTRWCNQVQGRCVAKRDQKPVAAAHL